MAVSYKDYSRRVSFSKITGRDIGSRGGKYWRWARIGMEILEVGWDREVNIGDGLG